jgi:hypothetical protein
MEGQQGKKKKKKWQSLRPPFVLGLPPTRPKLFFQIILNGTARLK